MMTGGHGSEASPAGTVMMPPRPAQGAVTQAGPCKSVAAIIRARITP